MDMMIFEEKQKEVTSHALPDGGYDMIICLNERQVERETESDGKKVKEWEYGGNIFRTYKLSPDDVAADPQAYLDYPGDEKPTEAMLQYATEAIDAYTMQLLQEGVLA